MARDVIITPASGLIDFQGSVGVSSATIELDTSGNLNIANPGGDLTLGDTSRDIYIGNGVANVDIVFEQNGEIRALTGKTISLGQTDSFISFAGNITSGLNVSGVITASSFVGSLTGTASSTTNIPNLSGDVTSVNTVTTLATVNSNVGTYGDAGAIPRVTVNAKGLVTGVTTVAPNNGTLTLAVSGTGLSGSASFTANQSGNSTFTVTSNATSVNINSTIVARNASGGFSAGIITATQFSTGASGVGVNINTNTISGPSELIIDPAAVGDNTGLVRIKGDLYVDGTTTQINSTSLEIADFVVGIASTATTDLLADGAGIKIGPDNTFLYEYNGGTNPSLKSSENLNVASGKVYQIGETEVLSSTTLGSGVINSSLTSVGTLGQLNVSGVSTFGGNVNLGDNDKFILGDGNDLQIYHNGSNSFISDTGIGNLVIGGSNGIILYNSSFTESLASFITNGAVELYYDSVKEFETTGYGATVFGTLQSQQLNVSGVSTFQSTVSIGTTIDIVPYDNLGTLSFEGSAGQLFSITNNLTSGSIFSVNDVSGIPSIDVDADGTVLIAPYGSTEYVGIGTTNPTAKLDVNGTVKATLFNGSGASLTNIPNAALVNSTVSYGGVTLSLGGSDATPAFNLQDATNYPYSSLIGITTSIVGDTTPQLGGNLDLNGNDITGTGNIDITGSLNVSGVSTFGGNVFLGDNDNLYFGDGNDLRIYHSGTDSVISETGSGNLLLGSDSNVYLFKPSTFEPMLRAEANGPLELYYDGSKKFETTGAGATVTGTISASGGFNLGISSAGTSITSGPVTTLNFIGAGNTFAVNGTTVDISIAGGGGGGGASVAISTTPPTSPNEGDLWYSSELGRTFIYYNDGSSSQWVDSAPFNIPTEDPTPGKASGTFTATSGQTTFNYSYKPGYIDVFLNGIRLNSTEFTAGNGTSIVLGTPTSAGDILDVVEYTMGIGSTGPQGPGGPLTGVTTISTNGTYYPLFVSGIGTVDPYISITPNYLNFNPSSGTLNSNQLNVVGLSTLPIINGTHINITGVCTALDFNSTSDKNLKTNISIIENSVDKILRLNGVTFTWKNTTETSAGVIAQDVESVLPEIIRVDSEGYKSVNYNGLVGLLIEAVKDQQKEINILKQQIENLQK